MAFYASGKGQLDQRHLNLPNLKSCPPDKSIDIDGCRAQSGDNPVSVTIRKRLIGRGFCRLFSLWFLILTGRMCAGQRS